MAIFFINDFQCILLNNLAWGSVVVKALRYYSDGPGIDPSGVTLDLFRGSFRQNHVP